MPLIEEIPTTTLARPSHGWAYIPVTDNAPIAAVQLGSRSDRKARSAHITNANKAAPTAKQEKAIQARLDALNKENHRDGVHVPLPPRSAERDAGRRRGKMTSNVRRILGYQRGFVHWLGEEEANAANAPVNAMPPPTIPAGGSGTSTPTSAPGNKRARPSRASVAASSPQSQDVTMTEAPSAATARKNRALQRAKANTSKTAPNTDVEKSSSPAPTPIKSEPQPTQPDTLMPDVKDATTTDHAKPAKPASRPYPESYDKNPLLKTLASEVPLNPTERVMQLLLAEPPLSYSAARAKPLDRDLQKPPRHFCGVCGYWGRVRCKGCADWTCGIMECWRGHQGVCPAAV